MAAACLHVMNLPKPDYQAVTEPMLSHINVGTGVDVTIRELAETIQKVVGFAGEIIWDSTKPDGTPRKLMDNAKLRSMGWQPTIDLAKGLELTYQWFIEHQANFKSH
jgi:GDP-L-fucose synthase